MRHVQDFTRKGLIRRVVSQPGSETGSGALKSLDPQTEQRGQLSPEISHRGAPPTDRVANGVEPESFSRNLAQEPIKCPDLSHIDHRNRKDASGPAYPYGSSAESVGDLRGF
jgi:hypothetical protein